MKWRLSMGCMMVLPTMAMAELHENNHWRDCGDDRDCIAIQGKCDLTAVNTASRAEATAYYKQDGMQDHCVTRFWKPKTETVRCRLNQCETIPQQSRAK